MVNYLSRLYTDYISQPKHLTGASWILGWLDWPKRTGCTTKPSGCCSCFVATNIHPSLTDQQMITWKMLNMFVGWVRDMFKWFNTGSYAYHMHISSLLSLILNPCSSFWHSRSLVHSLKHHFLCHLSWSICGFSGPCKLRSHLVGLTMFLFHDSGQKHKRGPPIIFVGLYLLTHLLIHQPINQAVSLHVSIFLFTQDFLLLYIKQPRCHWSG